MSSASSLSLAISIAKEAERSLETVALASRVGTQELISNYIALAQVWATIASVEVQKEKK